MTTWEGDWSPKENNTSAASFQPVKSQHFVSNCQCIQKTSSYYPAGLIGLIRGNNLPMATNQNGLLLLDEGFEQLLLSGASTVISS